MPSFKAIVVDKTDAGQAVQLTDFDEKNLMDGDVTVHVEYSTVNYKDGLAVTGKAPVVRRFPMIAGVDFAGTVEASSHPAWKPGDKVILNGWGLGETHLGAYAQMARVKGDRHCRLHRNARRYGFGACRPRAGARSGDRDRRRRRRRLSRGRTPRQAR